MKILHSKQHIIPQMTTYELSENEVTDAIRQFVNATGPTYRLQMNQGIGATLYISHEITPDNASRYNEGEDHGFH